MMDPAKLEAEYRRLKRIVVPIIRDPETNMMQLAAHTGLNRRTFQDIRKGKTQNPEFNTLVKAHTALRKMGHLR